MARKAFTEHPDLMVAGRIANQALETAVTRMGCDPLKHLIKFDAHANRVVDELTKLLLKARDEANAKGSPAGAA